MNAKLTRIAVRLSGMVAVAAMLTVGAADAARPTSVAAKKAVRAKTAKAAQVKPTAVPDGFHHATRLGGPRSLVGPVASLKGLKRVMAQARTRRAVQGAIEAAGVGAAVRDQIMTTLVASDPAVMNDAAFGVGDTIVWMGLKTKGKPDVLRNVVWNGRKPFPGWTFDVDDGETLYHFIFPKACGNLSLVSSERSPKAIAAENARRAEDARRAEAARRADEAQRAEAARRAEEARLAAAAAVKRAEEARLVEEARKSSEAQKEAQLDAERAAALKADKANIFFEGDFGMERRDRVVGLNTLTDPPTDVIAPLNSGLFGEKLGVDVRLAQDWRLAPSVGGAINTRRFHDSSLFAEVEINRWFGRQGFVGTGFGVWDFTRGDTIAPTWLLQGGKRVWQSKGARPNELHLVASGRLFLNKLDSLSDNYQFWAGLRFIVR